MSHHPVNFHYDHNIIINPKSTAPLEMISSRNNKGEEGGEESKKEWCGAITFFLLLGGLLCIIILPQSFYYIKYSEMCFAKGVYSNVKTDQIYGPGKYRVSPGLDTFVCFPSTSQLIVFSADSNTGLSVSAQGGAQITLSASLYVILPKENLAIIYNRFVTGDTVIGQSVNLVKQVIKDHASTYTIQDYIYNRDIITADFATAISIKLNTDLFINLEPNSFHLIDITYPGIFVAEALVSVLETENNALQLALQAVTTTKALTDQLVTQKYLQVNQTLATGNITSNLIISQAQNQAKAILLKARGEAFKEAFDLLNMTTSSVEQLTYIELLSIENNIATSSNTRVFYNVPNSIGGLDSPVLQLGI